MEDLCKSGSESLKIFGGTEFSRESRFMRLYEKHIELKNTSEVEKCKASLRRSAFLKFSIVGQDAMIVKRDIRVSVADLLSGFGKKCKIVLKSFIQLNRF